MHNHNTFQRQPPSSPSQPSLDSHHHSISHHSHSHNNSISSNHSHSNSNSNSSSNSKNPSRKTSIVELLSSPPPLPNTPDTQFNNLNLNEDINSFSLSRNTSISSKNSSILNNGIDWCDIPLHDLAESNKLISINSDYSIQKAYETLINHDLTSLPILNDLEDLSNCLTFDYSDLNTYLLLIMNKINLNDLSLIDIDNDDKSPQDKLNYVINIINKAKRGEEVPVDFIIKLHPKNPFLKFDCNDNLLKAMEALGNGVHRVAITNKIDNKENIIGILSQRRLIKYMWENARRFPSLDFYLNSTLQDLKIGSNNPITIYEDQLLIEALQKMFFERVSSLAVIDKNKLLIGNISIVDVKNVSSSKNSNLLFKSVINFIGYKLTQKGIEEGQDQFPIFHVNNQSSLGRVIAKLVATQSHRLWIVENRPSISHSISGPSSNIINTDKSNNNTNVNVNTNANKPNINTNQLNSLSPTSIESALQPFPSISNINFDDNNNNNKSVESSFIQQTQQSSLQSQSQQSITNETNGRPGKLIGVVTLTDILGLFATLKLNNGKKIDPQFARNQRRRSSTTSSITPSVNLNPTSSNSSSSGTTTGNSSSSGNGNGKDITGNSPSSPSIHHQDIFRKAYTSNKSDSVFSKDV